jgi:hypothetical protein
LNFALTVDSQPMSWMKCPRPNCLGDQPWRTLPIARVAVPSSRPVWPTLRTRKPSQMRIPNAPFAVDLREDSKDHQNFRKYDDGTAFFSEAKRCTRVSLSSGL